MARVQFAQQNSEKTANRNSRINFYFVTCFYSMDDICMGREGMFFSHEDMFCG